MTLLARMAARAPASEDAKVTLAPAAPRVFTDDTAGLLERPIGMFLTLDFETFYSNDYTLSKTTTSGYIRDSRFETIGVGVKINDGPTEWMEDHEFRAWVGRWCKGDWGLTAVLCHHSHFDGLILSHHYGIKPAFWADTLSMARALHGTEVGGSLAKLATYYGIGEKGHEVILAKNKRRADFTHEEWLQYGEYCKNDVELTYKLFHAMTENGFPEAELWSIDTTVRMFTEPSFVLDEPLLRKFLEDERKRKADLLNRVAKDRSVLLSNDKFAALLLERGEDPPRKVSPRTGKDTWAFAKTDPGMQALLEHEKDEIRWLTEARVGVKSTLNETRAERFLTSGADGRPVPVYLKYYGAHTGRWSAGDRTNFQNLVRGGELKKSLLAPEGHLLVAADSAQIEARVVAWLAGHDSLVEAFAQNRDVYSEFASRAYGRHIDRKKNKDDFIPGFVAKTCFAADTLVLTERGWVWIVDVGPDDRVWDGVEWVSHEGAVYQGEKEVWEASSVAATPDHEILTEHGWREWCEVLTNPSLFASALNSANLPASAGSATPYDLGAPLGGNQSCTAPAGGEAWSTGITSLPGTPHDATGARRSRAAQSAIGNTSQPWLTTRTVIGFSIGSARALRDALIRTTKSLRTMAVAAFESLRSGAGIGPHSCDMCRPCLAGITRAFSSTEGTLTGDTFQGTSGSSPPPRTWATSEESTTLNSRSRVLRRRTGVFDLVSAGPRHRFTIWSSAGPLIVHNCVLGLGFGMGWAKFAGTMLKGAMGGPPVQFTEVEAKALHVSVEKFASDRNKAARVADMPSRLPFEDRLIHCAVANEFVRAYRNSNGPIVHLWDLCNEALDAMVNEVDMVFGPGGILRTIRHGIIMPNGMILRYPGLREDEDGFSYMGGRGGKERVRAYGGSITENIVQALARTIVAEQMLRARAAGYRVVSMTHDELVLCVPEKNAAEALKVTLGIMKTSPAWAAGLPLNAEGGVARAYGNAK